MDVNKGIAAVLVGGIAFFLTGLIGDNCVVSQVKPEQAGDRDRGRHRGRPAPRRGAEQAPRRSAPLLAAAESRRATQFVPSGLHRLPHVQRGRQAGHRAEPVRRRRRAA